MSSPNVSGQAYAFLALTPVKPGEEPALRTYLEGLRTPGPSPFARVAGTHMARFVIVEQFFLLNGMGRLTVESIFRREYPTVQYCVVVLALIYVVVNFVIDIAYAWIDPRVRAGRALG